jgi:uracil-DNA glycosylase family 4
MSATGKVKQKAPYANCDGCPLRDRPFAASTGPQQARIAVVSRSPGYYEGLQGKSFSGPSGKVLDHLLQLHGVSRDEVLATNAVLCQSDGTEDGFAKAIQHCQPRLEHELQHAETVIACGREAAWSIAGESNISQNRGFVHYRDLGEVHGTEQLEGKKQRVIITNNPAVVLRDDGTFPELTRDFRLAIDPLPEPKLPKVRWIDDEDEARDVAEKMLEQISDLSRMSGGVGVLISSDLEVSRDSLKAPSHTGSITCAGFSIRPEKSVVFGLRACESREFRLRYLRELYGFHSGEASYLWHNGKYDVKVLRANDINARVDEDTMLLSWCLDERPGDPESGAGGHSLEWLLKDELGWPRYEPASVRHFKKTGQFLPTADGSIEQAKQDLFEYNGLDTAGCLGLFQILSARAKNDNVWDKPYKLLLLRLSESLARIELEGMAYDSEAAANILEAEVWPKLQAWSESTETLVGRKINFNSPKQMNTLYYDEWELEHQLARPKVERKGKKSTDQHVREQILERGTYKVNTEKVHPDTVVRLTQLYDDWKSLDKQRGQYLEGLVLIAQENKRRDGRERIYTDFKIHGTESGRLSSSRPNLQNVTRTKAGFPNVRSPFIPDPGCVLISADLSQAELRTIAVLSGDTNLQSIYLDTDRSLHKEVAAQFYGEDYTYEQYVRAKNINFGVAYWQSAYSFAQLYNMPQSEAQEYIDFWWDRFPDVWAWTKSIEAECLERGEIQSPFGHKRRCYVIPAEESARIHVVKEFINFKPQNIAACITEWAMCDLVDWLVENDKWDIAQPRINVHDAIVINVKRKHVEEIAHKTVKLMAAAPKKSIGWDFPYAADVSMGENWGSMKEIEL